MYASSKEIKHAYKKLARLNHPDIVATVDDPELREKAGRDMIQLNKAKEILLDTEKRDEYDIQLEKMESGEKISFIQFSDDSDTIEVFEIDSDSEVSFEDMELEESEDYSISMEVEELSDEPADSWSYSDEQSLEGSGMERRIFSFCPQCGAENVDDRAFCYNCNEDLMYYQWPKRRPAYKSQGPAASIDYSEIVSCPNCGAKNFKRNFYCYFCNMNLISYPSPINSPRPAIKLGSEPIEVTPQDSELLTCHHCGAGNLLSSTFCRICHSELKYYKEPKFDRDIHPEPVKTQESSTDDSISWECPNCGSENPIKASICKKCDEDLNPKPGRTPISDRYPTAAIDFEREAEDSVSVECPNCEREVFPEQTYCYYCGYEFPKYNKSKKR
jgi:ribosomal protein L40E